MASDKYLVQTISGRELTKDDFGIIRVGYMRIIGDNVATEERGSRYFIFQITELGTCIKTQEVRKSKHPIITIEIFGEKRKETKALLEDKLLVKLEPYEP